jgi:hypothetical protein
VKRALTAQVEECLGATAFVSRRVLALYGAGVSALVAGAFIGMLPTIEATRRGTTSAHVANK